MGPHQCLTRRGADDYHLDLAVGVAVLLLGYEPRLKRLAAALELPFDKQLAPLAVVDQKEVHKATVSGEPHLWQFIKSVGQPRNHTSDSFGNPLTSVGSASVNRRPLQHVNCIRHHPCP
jgi:hypothetical protein